MMCLNDCLKTPLIQPFEAPLMLALKITAIILGVLLILCVIWWAVAYKNYQADTHALQAQVLNNTSRHTDAVVDFSTLENLPEPVKRYFYHVLRDGQPYITQTRLKQTGALKVSPTAKNWSSFEALYLAKPNPAAFLWDAKISLFPGLHIRVRDSFVHGVGAGHIALLSVLTMGKESNKPALNSGAFYRYLAEAIWHPTSLLPESGVVWLPLDQNQAVAHLAAFGLSISLTFRFNATGEIISIYTEDRFGKFGDHYRQYPWEGSFRHYQTVDGVKIPTEAEVGWHLPEGFWLFWKAKIQQATFE